MLHGDSSASASNRLHPVRLQQWPGRRVQHDTPKDARIEGRGSHARWHVRAHTSASHGALGCFGSLCDAPGCWGRTLNRWHKFPPRIVMFNYLRPINTFVMGENSEDRGGKYERQETWQWVYGKNTKIRFAFLLVSILKQGCCFFVFCFF